MSEEFTPEGYKVPLEIEKLFEVEPETRAVTFQLYTYKGNRVIGKILKTLKENGTFDVQLISGSGHEHKVYEIKIVSSEAFWILVAELREEIELMIPELFGKNYTFNFTRKNLGFVNSFYIEGNGERLLTCSHRIKEIKTDGRSNVPTRQIIK